MSTERDIRIAVRLTAEESALLTALAGGKPIGPAVREAALVVARQAASLGLTAEELGNAVIVSPDTRILTVGVVPSTNGQETA